MRGSVNPRRQPILPVQVRGSAGQEETIESLLDTGFNGGLTLPQSIVTRLGLALQGKANSTLADGSQVEIAIYSARVIWDGTERTVSVAASGRQPLLGMSLALGHHISIDMVDGGQVALTLL